MYHRRHVRDDPSGSALRALAGTALIERFVSTLLIINKPSALDELEDDEDFATVGTDKRAQGVGDAEAIKAMEVRASGFEVESFRGLAGSPPDSAI